MEQASESGEERPVESDHSEFDVELSGDEDSEDIAGRIPTAGKIEMRNILSGAVPVPTVTILDRSAQSGDLRRKDIILYKIMAFTGGYCESCCMNGHNYENM